MVAPSLIEVKLQVNLTSISIFTIAKWYNLGKDCLIKINGGIIILKMPSLLVVLLLLLTACSSKSFTFIGETENWSAELKVTQTSNDYETQDFKLQFKGEDINSVGEIAFNIDTNSGGFGYRDVKLNKNGFLTGRNEVNPTNAKVNGNSEVKVTVVWNGKTETILLNKK